MRPFVCCAGDAGFLCGFIVHIRFHFDILYSELAMATTATITVVALSMTVSDMETSTSL